MLLTKPTNGQKMQRKKSKSRLRLLERRLLSLEKISNKEPLKPKKKLRSKLKMLDRRQAS